MYHLQHKFENGIGYMACPGEKDHKGNEFEFYTSQTQDKKSDFLSKNDIS